MLIGEFCSVRHPRIKLPPRRCGACLLVDGRLVGAVAKERLGDRLKHSPASFNENEPIVDTPEQAVDCFMRTDMGALCVGHYFVIKPGLEV